VPTYTYQCDEGHQVELVMTIAQMEEYEAHEQRCFAPWGRDSKCCNLMHRILMPPRRHVTFHEGYYEHVSEDGAHISNMSDLRRIAKENGNYSLYAEDLGGLFRAKEGRWI